MQFIRHQLGQSYLSSCVATIGNFDGLHLGHKTLLREVMTIANQRILSSVLITFDPLPKEYFMKENAPARLMNFADKYLSLLEMNLDVMVSLRFNAQLARFLPEDFIKQVMIDQFGVRVLVVGDDFRFGRDRVGDINLLNHLAKKYNFELIQKSSVECDAERISSTRVRNALMKGKCVLAKKFLDKYFTMTGRVIHGDQRGREWGFPTANIPLHRQKTPVQGVFAVRVFGEDIGFFYGVASVGFRPMFNVKKPLLEVYLLDFDADIYGKRLSVEFLHKIRDEANLNSVDKLIIQIKKDVIAARHYFKKIGH